VTASFGVAQRLADTSNPEELIDLADQALLVAKRSGRDRVVRFQTISAAGQLYGGTRGPASLFQDAAAKDVMTTIVASLDQSEPVGHAAQYFLKFRFTSAPVVDQNGKLVGILSERDVMSVMLLPNWWKQQIRDVMKQNVVCYDEGTPVLVIYEFLSRVSLRSVVIVRDGRPTGMISRSSLLRWFSNRCSIDGQGAPPDERNLPAAVAAPTASQHVALLARALVREAADLEKRLESETREAVPVVIGGVSRLEELLHDLLAHARGAGLSPSGGDGQGLACDTALGLAAVLSQSGGNSDLSSAVEAG
jgi:CBS domain-containing protein